MTHQQELELLAEWLGFEYVTMSNDKDNVYCIEQGKLRVFDPSPTGNSDDFLNMMAVFDTFDVSYRGRYVVVYASKGDFEDESAEVLSDHNNDKLAAMKHAAYQVCLMAAKEWKEATR